jgi:hypothetical protein
MYVRMYVFDIEEAQVIIGIVCPVTGLEGLEGE